MAGGDAPLDGASIDRKHHTVQRENRRSPRNRQPFRSGRTGCPGRYALDAPAQDQAEFLRQIGCHQLQGNGSRVAAPSTAIGARGAAIGAEIRVPA